MAIPDAEICMFFAISHVVIIYSLDDTNACGSKGGEFQGIESV